MKLKELFDVEETNDTSSHSDDSDDFIGGGFYSRVFNSKSDPHMVNKISRGTHDDPYFLFVEELIKSGIYKHNPHFPRIYSVNKDNQTAQLEKLINYRDIDPEILMNYLKNNFEINRIFPEYQTPSEYHEIACSIIQTNEIESIKSDTIKEATEFLHEVAKKNKDIVFDLSPSNILYRRIPSGIQLVISDPFAA